jgi:membrane-associated phospholipid phosphatase
LARSWAVAFGLCVLLTIVGKFVFHLVRWNEENSLRLLSPSGHVAVGTCFYGCCAIMLTARRSRAVRVLVWVGTSLLLGMLAASRLMLGLHSVPEIMVAFAIGGASLVVFTLHSGNTRPIPLNAGQVISLLFLIFVTYYMPPIDGEALIAHVIQMIDH